MNIKHAAACALALVLSTTGVLAAAAGNPPVGDSERRDATIVKIESTYTRGALFAPDSPIVKTMLGSAKTANPGTQDDVIAALAPEVAPALSQVFTQRGGLYDTLLRTALEPLSQEELERLEALLNDPVYLKFQMAMSATTAQQKFMQAIMGNTLRMQITINEILVKHGLREVH